MKFLSKAKIDLKGKKVLLRVDFNVPVKNGKIEDDFRIRQTMPTINFLKRKGAEIILLSHGNLKPVEKYLGMKFALGNLRNFPGEEKNDLEFAKKLAGLGDVYVNDAFSVSHREHASIVGLPKFLPHYAGLLFEKELKNLKSAFHPEHPFLLILGGIKFETKLGVVNKFLRLADKIFIGGALVVKAMEMPIANSPAGEKKIIFPLGDPAALDSNAQTLEILGEEIKKAKFILWNGPLGDYERGYAKGTKELARLIAKSKAKSIIGGGDTIAVVRKAKISLNKFSFVSTAGGAMLEFLAKGTLPGIKALER